MFEIRVSWGFPGFPSGFTRGSPRAFPLDRACAAKSFVARTRETRAELLTDLCLGEVCPNPISNDRVTRMPRPHPTPRGFESV